MSAFRVGQRVRNVRPVTKGGFGRQGVITAFDSMPAGSVTRSGKPLPFDCDVAVLWDGESVECAQHTDQLEPILPEGAAPSTWAECVWQPEHMRATA